MFLYPLFKKKRKKKGEYKSHFLMKCLLKHFIKGKIEGTRRQKRRCKRLLKKGKRFSATGLDRLLGFQEVEATRISRQSAHEGSKVVSPRHRPSLLSGRIPGSYFC